MKQVILALIISGLAHAEDSPAPPLPPDPPAPAATPDAIKLGDVTFTGSLRSRLYVWNWFQAANGREPI